MFKRIFKVLLLITSVLLLSSCNIDKEGNCCTCKDCPQCDVCCDCANPYLNK